MKIRFTHATKQLYGSKVTIHIWIGQIFNEVDKVWEDQTEEYNNYIEAEIAMLRNIAIDYGVEYEQNFERGKIQ